MIFESSRLRHFTKRDKTIKAISSSGAALMQLFSKNDSKGLTYNDKNIVLFQAEQYLEEKKMKKKTSVMSAILAVLILFAGCSKTSNVAATAINPFDSSVFNADGCVAVVFDGYSPYIYCSIENECTEPYSYVMYTTVSDGPFAAGEEITVSAELTEEGTKAGYVLTQTETAVTAEGNGTYITDKNISDELQKDINYVLSEKWDGIMVISSVSFYDSDGNEYYLEENEVSTPEEFTVSKIMNTENYSHLLFTFETDAQYDNSAESVTAYGYMEVEDLYADNDMKEVLDTDILVDDIRLFSSKDNLNSYIENNF